MAPPSLHPLLDAGLPQGSPSFPGGILKCHCTTDPVSIQLSSNVAHNHACGCSKCWKPSGALFSVVGVVPRTSLSALTHPEKLTVVDPSATILRHACRDCGVHLYGRIEKEHAFKGLDFVHVELSDGKGREGWQEPQFAAFVSSIIEQGFKPEGMAEVRGRFEELGLATYDCLSPTLMDLIAAFGAKQAGLL